MQLRKSIPSILSEKHNRFNVSQSCDYEKLTDMLIIDRFSEYDQQCSNDSLALVFSSRPIKMSPRFVLGRENVPCVAEVVNSSLKADCTDFTSHGRLFQKNVCLGIAFSLVFLLNNAFHSVRPLRTAFSIA